MKNGTLRAYLNFFYILSIIFILVYYEDKAQLPEISFLNRILDGFPRVKYWLPWMSLLFIGITYLQYFYYSNDFSSETVESKVSLGYKWLLMLFITGFLLAGQKLNPPIFIYLYPLLVSTYILILKFLQKSSQNLHPKESSLSIKTAKKKFENESSFHWKTENGFINVVNPFQGILIVGGAGSGKTYSLIQEIILQSLKKGYTGFIYDYKFPELSDFTSQILTQYPQIGIHPYFINFTDPYKSHRVNPLHPRNLPISLYANEYAMVILKSLKKEWVHKQDFWADNSIAYLKAIIWYLRKHEPNFCTLPHVISIAMQEYPWVLEMLASDSECKTMIASLWTAYKENAAAQIAGCISSLQNPLDKLNNPNLFYILSGDEVSLHLNQPTHPALLCMGNHPSLSEALNPIISLVASVVMKNMNLRGNLKSIFLLDEAPTLYLPNLKDLPNTGRSNLISTIYCCQDFSQMDLMYGKEEAKVIRASLGNQFLGMVNDYETSLQISQLFGKEEKTRKSRNQSLSYSTSDDLNQSSGFSYQTYEKEVLKPNAALSFPPGYFVGKITSAKSPFFAGKPIIENRRQIQNLSNFRSFKGLKFSSNTSEKLLYSSENHISTKNLDNRGLREDSFRKKVEIKQQIELDMVIQWNYQKIFQEAEEILFRHKP